MDDGGSHLVRADCALPLVGSCASGKRLVSRSATPTTHGVGCDDSDDCRRVQHTRIVEVGAGQCRMVVALDKRTSLGSCPWVHSVSLGASS